MARLSLVVAALIFLAVTSQAGEKPKYNVLLLMADDLRPALKCYGDAHAKTPNLDRLASRGVRFDRAYSQYTVCNPSRTSMLTSTRPERNGVTSNGTEFRKKLPKAITLPQLFRQHGAIAFSYGKILDGPSKDGQELPKDLDLGRSWDHAQMFQPTRLGESGVRRNLTGGKLEWCVVGAMEGSDDDQADGQTATAAIKAIEKGPEMRWFIAAGFHRPHDPFLVRKAYVDQFGETKLTPHKDPSDASPLVRHALGRKEFLKSFAKFSDTDRVDLMKHYYAGVTQTDAQIGRIMDALDQFKLWDSTVVVFVSDHGYHLGEHGWWNKSTVFEVATRVPFILVAPGIKPGVCRSLVELMDVYPTIADLCDLPTPSTVQGKSLRRLLENPEEKIHEGAITYVDRGLLASGFSLRTDRWRYTEWNRGRETELYDHQADPGEFYNLAKNKEYNTQRKELAELLRKLQETGKAR